MLIDNNDGLRLFEEIIHLFIKWNIIIQNWRKIVVQVLKI